MKEVSEHLRKLAKTNKLPNAVLLSDFPDVEVSKIIDSLSREILSTKETGRHPDFVDIKSENVEDVRRLLSLLSLKSFNKRLVVIRKAESLTRQAVNTLLKRIEEPSDSTYFVVISAQEEVLLPTLRSRLTGFKYTGDRNENVGDVSKKFVKSPNFAERCLLMSDFDPHAQDINLFLKELYMHETGNITTKSPGRLGSILNSFNLLRANVNVSRVLTALALSWK